MKNEFISVVIMPVILFSLLSCTKNSPTQSNNPPEETPTEDPITYVQFIPHAEMSLVKVGSEGTLAKAMGESDINFGEILATKKLSYIIMNTGNMDIFDIQFNSNKLEIFPNSIGILEVPKGGLSTTPIVTFTVPHVIPSSGVGSYLDMEIGNFIDTLILDYKYQVIPFEHAALNADQIISLIDSIIVTSDTTADTVWVYGDTLNIIDIEKDTLENHLKYSISGTKKGAIINIVLADTNIDNYNLTLWHNYTLVNSPWDNWPFVAIVPDNPPTIPLTYNLNEKVINSGNIPIRIRVVNYSLEYTFIDTVLRSNTILDITGLLCNDQDDYKRGNTILMGDVSNQPYIFKFLDQCVTSGYCGLIFSDK